MTNEQYLAAQRALVGAAMELGAHDWSAFLACVEHAESVGPLLDPTLYMKAGEALRGVKDVARAAQAYTKAAKSLPPAVVLEALQATGAAQ